MTTLKLKPTAGPDGVLRLEVPVEADTEYEVTVKPVSVEATLPYIHPGWPKGYFDATYGSITDPAFKRYPLGPPRIPPSLDSE